MPCLAHFFCSAYTYHDRLEEQSDFVAAKDLFGGAGSDMDLEKFLPRTLKDFEQFAAGIVGKYVVPHKDSKNYKGFIKALFKVRFQGEKTNVEVLSSACEQV